MWKETAELDRGGEGRRGGGGLSDGEIGAVGELRREKAIGLMSK